MTAQSHPSQPGRSEHGRHGVRRTSSAIAAGMIGLLALSSGAALAFRHLQKAGLTAVALIGFALLALGLVALAWSATVLWRRTRGWRRLWFIPAGLVAIVVMFSVSIAVLATFVPPTPLSGRTPTDHRLPFTEVTLRTEDGVSLSAWWIASTNGAAVVLMHGSGENKAALLDQAEVLAEHGYGALLVDARGHGSSGGRAMDFGWYGDSDIRAAVDFLAHQDDVEGDRLAVLGLSLGGEEAIGAAAADPRIRAVVAEGATGRTAADKAGWLPGGLLGAIQRGIDQFTYAVVDLLTQASPPTPLHTAVAQATGTQFLLITAGTVADEARSAAALRDAAQERVQVWNVPGAGHTQGLRVEPAAWETRVIAFLDGALL